MTSEKPIEKIKVILAVIIVMITGRIYCKPDTLPVAGKPIHLNYVFGKNTDDSSKIFLKLYDNQTYEYLKFYFHKNIKKQYRETGYYEQKGNRITLKNRAKIDLRVHPKIYRIKEKRNKLHASIFNFSQPEKQFILMKDSIFWKERYQDSLFGMIENIIITENLSIRPNTHFKPPIPIIYPTDSIGYDFRDYFIQYETPNLSNNMLSRDSLKKIKVVMVVSYCELNTFNFVYEHDIVATHLLNLGIEVVKLFHPNDSWEKIVNESKDADILIYSGHGGEGGAIMAGKKYISPDKIQKELKLKKNSLVIFNHACNSAGSSAWDIPVLDLETAKQRVENFSDTYFRAGATAYYADNYFKSTINFLDRFLSHNSIQYCYVSAVKDVRSEGEFEGSNRLKKNYDLAISTNELRYTDGSFNGVKIIKEYKPYHKSYNQAYSAPPNFSVKSFFER